MVLKSNDNHNKNQKLPQYLVAASVAIQSFSCGIHYGWPSPSLPKLMSEEYPLNITSEDASYITIISSVGDILAYIIFSFLMDLIGRKISLLMAPLLSIISLLLIYFSIHSIVLSYIARIVGGMTEGILFTLIPIYIGEISEPRIRGTLYAANTFFWCFGILFINIVGSLCTIQTTSLISLIFPVIFLITFAPSPETPTYFLMKNKTEKARTSLKKLRWNEDVEDELLDMIKYIKKQMAENGSFRDIFQNRINRKAFLIGLITILIDICSGMASLTFYAQIFFAEATDVITEEWAASLMILFKLIFFFVSVFIVDIVGRRPLLLFSTAACFFMLLLLSTFFLLKDYSSLNFDGLSWIPLALMILFTIFYNLGIGNIGMWILTELLPTSVKTKAVCLSTTIFSILLFGTTKLYQSLADNYSLGLPLAIFAVLEMITFGLCWRWLPETKGKSFEEIQTDYQSS